MRVPVAVPGNVRNGVEVVGTPIFLFAAKKVVPANGTGLAGR